MHPQPVAAALLSLFNRSLIRALQFCGALLFCLAGVVRADTLSFESMRYASDGGQLAEIRLHTADELLTILRRAEGVLFSALEDDPAFEAAEPIYFLLHGEEAKVFFRRNYLQHQELVDLAARLSAFGVIQVRVCERWMGGNDLDPQKLQPFVGTVPWAAREISRLMDEKGYIYF